MKTTKRMTARKTYAARILVETEQVRKAVLEARLTRRFAGAMLAQTLAIIGAIAALLRLPG